MYVVPQTVVKFYRDIPWTDDYKHTIWFVNANAQNTFFASKLAYTYTDFTYVRQTGVIRVPRIADDLYNCNYISFLNAGYGNKTFYAFITKVDYVNNETTDIHFKLDYIQTWRFDITVEQCFVEREHVADDTIGLHTVDEKLETGEYLIENEASYKQLRNTVMLGKTIEFTPPSLQYIGGVLNGLDIIAGHDQDTAFLNALVGVKDTPEKIGFIRMISDDMLKPGTNMIQTFDDSFGFTRNNAIVFHNACEGKTYTPKNNKLKCYPYCCFTVDNFCGDVTQYRWEEFTSPFSANFVIKGTPLPIPVMECFPVDYKKNYSAPTSSNTKQFVTIYDNFPEVPMSTDTFKIWETSQFKKDMASEGASIVTGSVSTAVLVAAGIMTENPVLLAGGIASGVATAVNSAKKGYDIGVDYSYHKLHNSSLVGSTQSAGLNWNDDEVGFRFTEYRIKAEFAQMIDNFLTRFGYKVDVIKVPELTSRRYFNYVKTIDADVRGNIPSDCQKVIASIFNSGITLWHTSDVGNYNVDNAIVG